MPMAVKRDWLVVAPEPDPDPALAAALEALKKAVGWYKASKGGPRPAGRHVAFGIQGLADAIVSGNVRAVENALIALGRLAGMEDEEWNMRDAKAAARAIRQRAGAQRRRKVDDAAAVLAYLETLNGGQLLGRAKRGTVQRTAAEFRIAPDYVTQLVNRSKRMQR